MNENNEHIITANLRTPLNEAAKKRLAASDALQDEDIDYSDIPPLSGEWLAEAAARPRRAGKKPVNIRLDEDIVEFFKREDAHYQSRINAVLRCYVDNARR